MVSPPEPRPPAAGLVERHRGIGSHLEADDVGDLGPVPLPQPGVAEGVEQRHVLLTPMASPKKKNIKYGWVFVKNPSKMDDFLGGSPFFQETIICCEHAVKVDLNHWMVPFPSKRHRLFGARYLLGHISFWGKKVGTGLMGCGWISGHLFDVF